MRMFVRERERVLICLSKVGERKGGGGILFRDQGYVIVQSKECPEFKALRVIIYTEKWV